MEIGNEVTIYCFYKSRLVNLKCENNGTVNDGDVAKACDRHQRHCIYDSELGLLQNLKPKKHEVRTIKNGARRKFVCKNNQMAKINGLYYNKLDIQCYSGRFHVVNYDAGFNYGKKIKRNRVRFF